MELHLSIDEIIHNIKSEEVFEGIALDDSFSLKIDKYVPFVCAAIHDGHQFRKSLLPNCLHSDYDRWYEEDPATKEMVHSLPIVIAGCDSRFEYDLNRSPNKAIYKDAWGKQLWKNPLSKTDKKLSLEKYYNFYRVVNALIEKIESKYGIAMVYDMHSYNWRRWNREVPTFNIGSKNVDNDRFGNDVELWRTELSTIQLSNKAWATALLNDTFEGNGYFLRHITKKFRNTLVLATEVKKIYCDEINQRIYPEVVSSIEKQLKVKLWNHVKEFYRKHRN